MVLIYCYCWRHVVRLVLNSNGFYRGLVNCPNSFVRINFQGDSGDRGLPRNRLWFFVRNSIDYFSGAVVCSNQHDDVVVVV